MKFVALFVIALAVTSTSARFLSKSKTSTVLAEVSFSLSSLINDSWIKTQLQTWF